MPIYEYDCANCGTFEINRRITDAPLRRCPTCKGKVSKLISQTSFQLKGSGWYATDYASKGSAKSTDKATDSKGEGSPKSESSDAKKTSKDTPAKDASSGSSGKSEATAA